MAPRFYQELIKALNNPEQALKFDSSVLNSQDGKMMTFTIKNY
jgi:hypothetical protein